MYSSQTTPLKQLKPFGADLLERCTKKQSVQAIERFEKETLVLMVEFHRKGIHFCCEPLDFEGCANAAYDVSRDLIRICREYRNGQR